MFNDIGKKKKRKQLIMPWQLIIAPLTGSSFFFSCGLKWTLRFASQFDPIPIASLFFFLWHFLSATFFSPQKIENKLYSKVQLQCEWENKVSGVWEWEWERRENGKAKLVKEKSEWAREAFVWCLFIHWVSAELFVMESSGFFVEFTPLVCSGSISLCLVFYSFSTLFLQFR